MRNVINSGVGKSGTAKGVCVCVGKGSDGGAIDRFRLHVLYGIGLPIIIRWQHTQPEAAKSTCSKN